MANGISWPSSAIKTLLTARLPDGESLTGNPAIRLPSPINPGAAAIALCASKTVRVEDCARRRTQVLQAGAQVEDL